jgi:Ribbon-helix-helix protein, copG family
MMKRKSYSKMTPAELAIATKRFDDEFVADEARPLTQDEQDQWIRVKAKRRRRKVGEGFQRISVSIEQGLLKRVTALAKERRISRSQLLAQALQDELARNRNRSRN